MLWNLKKHIGFEEESEMEEKGNETGRELTSSGIT